MSRFIGASEFIGSLIWGLKTQSSLDIGAIRAGFGPDNTDRLIQTVAMGKDASSSTEHPCNEGRGGTNFQAIRTHIQHLISDR
jgi:hypothetical protein